MASLSSTCLPVALLGVMVALPAAAAPVQTTLPVDAGVLLEISVPCGTLNVSTWSRPEVSVTGTADDPSLVEIKGGGERVDISVQRRARGCVDLDVRAPASARARVAVVSATTGIDGIAGPLTFASVTGELTVRGPTAVVEVATVSGDMRLLGAHTNLEVASVSGDITVGAASAGEVRVETVSGELGIEGGPYNRVEAESVSGDIGFAGSIGPTAEVAFETHSGDVSLRLARDASATVLVRTHNGSVEDRLGGSGSRGREASFALGSGSARVTVQTFSGRAVIEARP